jgi:glycosyltransferase involved in cell wall biosynthesis
MRETLSVILIAHDEEQAIGLMLEGLLKTYDREILEVIVVDDSSQDRTAEIVRDWAERNSKVRLIQRIPPCGVGRALKTGFSNINPRAEYALTMDSDFVENIAQVSGAHRRGRDRRLRRSHRVAVCPWRQGCALSGPKAGNESIVWPAKILFYLSYATVLFVFARQRKTFQRLIIYSMLGYLAYFSFNTSVHENHLFLVCCLAWILVFLEPEQLVRGINFSLAANANLFLFYGVFGQRLNPVIAGLDITLLFALANLCLFAGFLLHTFKADSVGLRLWQWQKPEPLDAAS